MKSYLGTSYFSAGDTTDVGFKRNELQIALCDPKLGINNTTDNYNMIQRYYLYILLNI
jgi:hypothetical protein